MGALPALEMQLGCEMDSAGQSLGVQTSCLLRPHLVRFFAVLRTAANICFSSPSLSSVSAIRHSFHPLTPLARHPILPTRHLLFLTREKKGRKEELLPLSPPQPRTQHPDCSVQFRILTVQDRTGRPQDQRCRPDERFGSSLQETRRGIKEEFRPLFSSFPRDQAKHLELSIPPTQLCTRHPPTPPTGILRLDDEESSNLHPLRSLRAA